MKNLTLTFVLFLSLSFAVSAQRATLASVELNKVSQPCVRAEYDISSEMVEGALIKKFKDARLGSGSKASDGFRVYKGVVIPEISKEKMDVYYKVEDKKPSSVLYVLMSKGYDNFMKMDPDSMAMKNAMIYFDLFVKDATAYLLNNQIEKQNEDINDLENKAKKSAKDGVSLLKDKAKIESRISENAIKVGELKNDMENEQKALEQVKIKTATIDQMNALKKEVNRQENLTKKATKNYDNAIDDAAGYKEDLVKTEKEIEANKVEQDSIKNEIEAAKRKLEELRNQLSALK